MYHNAERDVHNVKIHCIHPSQEKQDHGLDLECAPGAGYRQTLWVCLGFFVGLSCKELKFKEALSVSQKLFHSHHQAVSTVANGQNGHNDVGQTRKPLVTCSDFSSGQQK